MAKAKGVRLLGIIVWSEHTDSPKYEDTRWLWRGHDTIDGAIEFAVNYITDLDLGGAWIIDQRKKEMGPVYAKIYWGKDGRLKVEKYDRLYWGKDGRLKVEKY